MSILIPGKMPTECWECPCAYETEGAHHNYCQAAGYDTKLPDEGRPDWCPLIELPPHGDLVDRDHLSVVCYTGTEGLEDTFDNGVAWTLEYIDKLTPVIPADPEGGADIA